MKKTAILGQIGFIIIIIMNFFTMSALADEIGFAVGVNTSTYKAWSEKSVKYQKVNILNPIEITFQKNLNKFLGIYSGLQYSKRSISESIQQTGINPITGYLEPTGEVKYEKEMNFISLEISPIVFYRLNNFLLDGRLGVSGEFYINEWTNNFGGKEITSRNEEINSFVLSFVGGIGLGYIFKDKFKIGLRSSISRTLTDIYKNQSEDADIYYLNFHNVISFGFLF